MSLLRNLAGGLRGLFRKQQVEREMDEELRGYLDDAVNEKMRRGLNREQAVRAARIEMGGAESVKQRVRAASWESLVETLWHDLKFGLRLLRFSPAFAAAEILSLALGIGANTAIFQLLDAIRLRALPVKNAQELTEVRIAERNGATGAFVSRYPNLTNPCGARFDSSRRSRAYSPGDQRVSISLPAAQSTRSRAFGCAVNSLAYWELCPKEDDYFRLRMTAPSVPVVVSHAFWQREYGGDEIYRRAQDHD